MRSSERRMTRPTLWRNMSRVGLFKIADLATAGALQAFNRLNNGSRARIGSQRVFILTSYQAQNLLPLLIRGQNHISFNYIWTFKFPRCHSPINPYIVFPKTNLFFNVRNVEKGRIISFFQPCFSPIWPISCQQPTSPQTPVSFHPSSPAQTPVTLSISPSWFSSYTQVHQSLFWWMAHLINCRG